MTSKKTKKLKTGTMTLDDMMNGSCLYKEEKVVQMFTMWKVYNYRMSNDDINENILNFDLDEKIYALENSDESYHDRINPEKNYKFFGDIDHYPKSFDCFRDKLILFLKDYYDLHFTSDEIMHTVNHATKGSYHFVIPKFNCRATKIKEILDHMYLNDKEEFSYTDEKGKTKRIIDTCIYSVHWFRCPNQTKNGAHGTQHIIVNGEMKDFIFDYIENSSVIIDEKKYTPKIKPELSKVVKIPKIQKDKDETNDSKKNNCNNDIKSEEKILNPVKNQILNSEQEILYDFIDQCFSRHRYEEYQYWINVGMAIKNRYGDDGFEMFKYFSFKAACHDTENELKIKYNTFNSNTLEKKISIATMYYYAKEDNEEKFIELVKKNQIFKKFEMSSVMIVKYIKMLKPNDFIWKNNCLRCYNGKYWEQTNLPLMIYIGNELYDFLKNILTTCFWDTKQSKEFAQMKKSLDRSRSLQFKKEIVETSKEVFTNNEHTFDDKWYLFGFKNVVLDLRTLEFRNYKFDDYVTITTGYDWIEPEQSKVDKINELIESIHPNEPIRRLYLELLSTGIDGRCLEKLILFDGFGGNGKGLINDIALKTFGNYGLIGNNALLFETNRTGSNPEKNNLHLKRFVIFREPAEKSKIENSIMKELTGGGQFSARGLYESDTKKKLSSTTILECNKRPLFAEDPQEAELRRIIDIFFSRKFTDKKEDVDEENGIFLANIMYKNEDFQEEHKTALFKILLDAYKCYKNREYVFVIPKSVENRTKLYLQMSSSIFTWVSDEYEKTDDKNDIVKIKDMHYNFKASEYYDNLSKADKRKYNETFFRNEVSENAFLNKYYHQRVVIKKKEYYNILTNYKKKEELDCLE